MTVQVYHPTPAPTPFGSRPAKLDLARFSLDLSWARGVSDAARRAYPSPPMSGSPSQPPRHKNEFDERGHGAFGVQPQARLHVMQTSQTDPRDAVRKPSLGAYSQDPRMALQYSPYQPGGAIHVDQSQYQHQQQPPPQLVVPPLPAYQYSHSSPLSNPFQTIERAPNPDPRHSSAAPKTSRKTKGHVASACVPCKRAHLRCDAQRPCARCISNGKEDACKDMVHKKRGRPRLRDDRDARFEPNLYNQPSDSLMRRPLSLYSSGETQLVASEPLMKSSYRVLKSQSGPAPMARFIEHASAADANVYTPNPTQAQRQTVPTQILPTQTVPTQETAWMYLNMDFQIARASRSFCDAAGVPSVVARRLHEIVAPSDREKVRRLQRLFDEQRQKREPNYLPPIYGKAEEDRVIQSIGFGQDDTAQISLDRQEMLTFQGPNGEQRTFEIRMGLGKRESIFFIALKLVIPPPPPPPPPQSMHQFPLSPYARDAQYGFQPPQSAYTPQQPISPYQYQPQPFDEARAHEQPAMYRPPMPPGPTTTPATAPMSYAQPRAPSRQEYSQAQYLRQTPRSELQRGQPGRQGEMQLQLPPIRTQAGAGAVAGQQRDERSARLDIGGLIERPESQRRPR